MKTLKIKDQEMKTLIVGSEAYNFPKYATQIMNLANANAQGTRPGIVGQMSELFQARGGSDLTEWARWYDERRPDAIERAADRI